MPNKKRKKKMNLKENCTSLINQDTLAYFKEKDVLEERKLFSTILKGGVLLTA